MCKIVKESKLGKVDAAIRKFERTENIFKNFTYCTQFVDCE